MSNRNRDRDGQQFLEGQLAEALNALKTGDVERGARILAHADREAPDANVLNNITGRLGRRR